MEGWWGMIYIEGKSVQHFTIFFSERPPEYYEVRRLKQSVSRKLKENEKEHKLYWTPILAKTSLKKKKKKLEHWLYFGAKLCFHPLCMFQILQLIFNTSEIWIEHTLASDIGFRVVTTADEIVITSLLGSIKDILSYPPTAINKQAPLTRYWYSRVLVFSQWQKKLEFSVHLLIPLDC